LTGAALAGANLSGADLTDARGLTPEKLASAYGDECTILPLGFRRPISWQGFEIALAEGVSVANAWPRARANFEPDASGQSYVGKNLSKVNLSKAKLIGFNFTEADLSAADLSMSKLNAAMLCAADLTNANLSDASLIEADLTGAKLVDASLERTKLGHAFLAGANCAGACFERADLRGATLSGVSSLTQAQIESAVGDKSTRIPAVLVRPNHWLTFLEVVTLGPDEVSKWREFNDYNLSGRSFRQANVAGIESAPAYPCSMRFHRSQHVKSQSGGGQLKRCRP
jgi:uncharacterized protein YjbI with pentapeptide repeats